MDLCDQCQQRPPTAALAVIIPPSGAEIVLDPPLRLCDGCRKELIRQAGKQYRLVEDRLALASA